MLPLTKQNAKICILRLSALGDVTHVLPALNEIRASWPDAEITWVCGSFEYKLLRLIPGVRFITFNKKNGFKEYINLWKQLKHEKFDVLLQMQNAARANLASLAIKAGIRLGWDKSRSRDMHQLFINHCVPEVAQQHQLEGFLSFARTLGAHPVKLDWKIPVTKDAEDFCDKHLPPNTPLLVISPCSSHELRNWTASGYAKLADYAIDKHQMSVVLIGGPSKLEQAMASQIESHMAHQAINLVGKDTLEQLVGIVSRATVVVSPDSGPAHLAGAMGTPVIGLYACTWSKRSGPYNSLKYCVDKFPAAARSYLNKEPDQLRWGTKIEQPGVMALIRIDEVTDKLDLVMSEVKR